MKLAYKSFGERGVPIIILHGLFGSGDNWQTFARSLSEDHQVYLVDQRNHGRSPHTETMTYEEMAEDLSEFMDQNHIKEAVVMGHSMGGKTAMRFSQLFPERVLGVVVVDMGVKKYPPHHQRILEALKSMDPNSYERRGDAEKEMEQYIDEWMIRQFLLKNLYWKKPGEEMAWRFNVDTLDSEMDNILAPMPKDESQVPALFVRGAKSDYIPDGDWKSIEGIFPRSKLVTIDAGHWVHAEKPDDLESALREFLEPILS